MCPWTRKNFKVLGLGLDLKVFGLTTTLVRSKNELIPSVCHTILINRPVSEVIPFPIRDILGARPGCHFSLFG